MPARSFPGDAILTTITGDINASAETIPIAASDGWPTGSGGRPFCVRLESEDGTVHEKVLIASRSGLNLTVSARGHDDTVASSFVTGAQIWCVLDAATIESLTELLYDTGADYLTQYLTTARHAATAHLIGAALPDPGAPSNVSTNGSEGASTAPARGDHTHELDPSVAGAALALTDGVLAVVPDDATLAVSGDTIIVKDGGISTAKIAEQAITTDRLGADAVTGAKLADDAVDSEHIADGAIDTAHVADAQITRAKLSAGMYPPIICTSGTRPGSPATGQMIVETDTGDVLVYYGATTGWRPPWNTAWGYIEHAVSTANQSVTSAVNVTGMNIAFTALAGRRYRITASMPRMQVTAGSEVENTFYIADGSNVEQQLVSAVLSDNYTWSPIVVLYEEGLSGSVTRRARMDSNGTIQTNGASRPGTLLIEDIGPDGAPA